MSRPTTILLIRHAQTIWNHHGTRYCGSTDVDLSPAGRQQAGQLARALAREPLAAVWASPLGRARATAAGIAAAHGLPVQVHDGLRETDFGEFEGRTPEELMADRAPEFLAWRADPDASPPPGGETPAAALARAIRALEAIAGAHAGQTVACVAHNTLNRLVLCHVLGAPARNYRRLVQDNACINVLHWGPEVRVVAINRTGHLEKSER